MKKILAIDYVDQKTKHAFHLPITVFKKPSNALEYAKLEKILDTLIDAVRNNEKHPLAIAMQIIGENLEQYDSAHHPAMGLQQEEINEIEMVKAPISTL